MTYRTRKTPWENKSTPASVMVLRSILVPHYQVACFSFECDDSTRFRVSLSIDKEEFTSEELLATVFTRAKDEVTITHGVTALLKDCVLTVPAFYTQHERRALLDVTTLADLNVLALINDNTDTALHLGIRRIDDTPQLYLLYNMGASSVQASVVKYHSYKRTVGAFANDVTIPLFEVIGSALDATLSVGPFDSCLTNLMASKFDKNWNKKRSTWTIPHAVSKLRNDLDIDYKTSITHGKYDEACLHLLERVESLAYKAVEMANVSISDLNAAEMIGNATQFPMVKELVQHVLEEMKLKIGLIGNEIMPLGAASHGVHFSNSFQGPVSEITDINPYVIEAEVVPWQKTGRAKDGMEKRTFHEVGILFGMGSKLGDNKTIEFPVEEDLHVEIRYQESETLPKGRECPLSIIMLQDLPSLSKR